MTIGQMTAPDMQQVLRRQTFGYLSLVEADGTPYCTVVYYCIGQNGNLIAHTIDQQLAEQLRESPTVCFLVHDYTDSYHWALVRAHGVVQVVIPEKTREQLLAQLFKAQPHLTPEESKMTKGLHQAVVYEIVITGLEGEKEG